MTPYPDVADMNARFPGRVAIVLRTSSRPRRAGSSTDREDYFGA